MGRSFAFEVVDEDFFICTEDAEHVIVIDDGFGTAEEEVAAVIQRHMENAEKIPLQHRLEIDQQISAADEVELSERGILKYIVLCKYNHLPQIMPHHIRIPLARKVAGQALHAHIFYYIVAVDALAGGRDRIGIEVRRKYLYIPSLPKLLHDFHEEDGDRVGLLTGGAACDPDADLVALACIHDKSFNDPLFEHLKIISVTEETRDSDQYFLGQDPGFLGIILQVSHILLEIPVVSDHQSALDPAKDRRLFIIGIIRVRDVLQNREHLGEKIVIRQLELAGRVDQGCRDVGHLAGNRVRRLHDVDKPCGDRAAGHAVELGALG